MAQHIPFLFGAGGQPIPVPPSQQTQNPPNLQTPHVNGIAPQAQQAAFQQNAQLPGTDTSVFNPVLHGITPEQLAYIGHLYQTGVLAMPPIPASQPPAPAALAAGVQNSMPLAPAQPVAAPMLQQDMEVDREEGELEEGEEPDTSKEREFLRPPPTGPRKRSPSPRDRYGHAQADTRASFQEPHASPKTAKARRVSEQSAATHVGKRGASPFRVTKQPANSGPNTSRRAVDAGSAAKKFVLQMHNAGYTFEQLAKEIPNQKALRKMFKALGLPLPLESTVSQTDGAASSPVPQPQLNGTAPLKQSTAVTEVQKPSSSKKLVPAKSANREEYLAKLNAMKTKSASSAANPPVSKPAQQPSAPALTPSNELKPSSPGTIAQVPEKPSTVKSIPKTNLIRERLAKLKADQAAKSSGQSLSEGAVAPSPLVRPAAFPTSVAPQTAGFAAYNGLGSGLANLVAKASEVTEQPSAAPVAPAQSARPAPLPVQTSFSSLPPTPSRPFSALPGLFMGNMPAPPTPAAPQSQVNILPPSLSKPVGSNVPLAQPLPTLPTTQQLTESPSASPAPPHIVDSRPVVLGIDKTVLPHTAASASKQLPFGQSRSNSESERLIIEVSEDEEDEDDMDMDPTPSEAARSNGLTKQTPSRNIGLLPNFPPKANFSMPGTPSVATPMSAAEHAERVKAHESEMEKLKRQIAEKEALKLNGKTKGKAATGKGGVSAPESGKSTPAPQAQGVHTSLPVSIDTAIPNGAKQAPVQLMSAAAIARQQEKATLLLRLKELEGQTRRESSTSAALPPASGEALMSGALPNGEPMATGPGQTRITDFVPSSASIVEDAATTDQMDLSSAEDGELSDGAADVSERADNATPSLASPQDDGKIGSQASTVGTSQPQVNGAESGLARPAVGDSLVADEEMADTVATVIEEPAFPDVDPEREEDMEIESSDEEDDDSDDLDARVGQQDTLATLATLATPKAAVTEYSQHEDGEVDHGDSSSASSTRASDEGESTDEDDDDDEYEPELLKPEMVRVAEPAPAETGNDATPSAISDISGAKPVSTVHEASVADDLAPELQPAKEDQTIISAQVRDDSDWFDFY